MPRIRSIKELRVWQNAMDAAMRVFELTKRFPVEERYSMTDQFRRASRSVAANIAEAWRKRRYPAAFISKLNDAEGEAAETQTWAELALRSGYLSPSHAADLDEQYERILAQLVSMVDRPGDWALGMDRSRNVIASGGPPLTPSPPHPLAPSPRTRRRTDS